MNVVMTGSTSFIGKKLKVRLEQANHNVTAIGRSEDPKWELGSAIPKIDKTEVLIHLAHDRDRHLAQCVSDAQIILNSFPKRIVYISSVSAHQYAKSNYGKCKFGEEQVFLNGGAVVIKVGLVADPKAEGVYGMLSAAVRRLPIILLPLRGNSNFYISNIDDLVDEFVELVENENTGCVRGFGSKPIIFRRLILDIAKQMNKSILIFSLPKFPIHQILVALSRLWPRLTLLDSYFSLINEIPNREVQDLKTPTTQFKSSII